MIATRHTRKGLHRISNLARETGVAVGWNMASCDHDHGFIDQFRSIREIATLLRLGGAGLRHDLIPLRAAIYEYVDARGATGRIR